MAGRGSGAGWEAAVPLAQQRGGLDLVASVRSPYMALGVAARLVALERELGRPPRAVVFNDPDQAGFTLAPETMAPLGEVHILCPAPGDPIPLPRRLVQVLRASRRTRRLDARRLEVTGFLRADHWRLPELADLLDSHRARHVVLDEGASVSLPPELYEEIERRSVEVAGLPWHRARTHPVLKAKERILRLLQRRVEIVTMSLWRHADGRLKVDPAVAELYRTAVERMAHTLPADTKHLEDSVLYVSQPFFHLSPGARPVQETLVDEVAGTLASAGVTLCIKPHPRDEPGRWSSIADRHDATVLPSDAGVELVAARHRPRAVLGLASTCMPFLSAVEGMSVGSLWPQFASRIEDPLLRRTGDHMLNVFGDHLETHPHAPVQEATLALAGAAA